MASVIGRAIAWAALVVLMTRLSPLYANSFAPHDVPPDICNLTVTAERESGDVTIAWSHGTAPFIVVRSETEDFREATQLEVVASGIRTRRFVDRRAFSSDKRLFYQVYDLNSQPEVFEFSPDGGVPGTEITVRGIGFRADCSEMTVQAGGFEVPVKLDCGFLGFRFKIPLESMTGSLIVATPAGATLAGDHTEPKLQRESSATTFLVKTMSVEKPAPETFVRLVTLWRICPSVLVVMLALGCAAPPKAVLELKLTSSLPAQLPFVSPDLRLTLTNRSASPVLFPGRGVHVRLLLEHGDGWVACRPTAISAPAPRGTAHWEEIAGGGEMAIPVPATHCLCQDTPSTDICREWTDAPGPHRLKAIVSKDASDESEPNITPPGTFRGSLESPPVEIVVRQPKGVDAEAIARAYRSPMTFNALMEFPTSEYAALVWYGSLRLDTADPVKTRSLIERRLYPGPGSVPDATSLLRWRSLDSEGVARWRIAWGERILREYPSFAYRDEVRVLVALSQMSLGMKDEARTTLDAVAANENTAAGRWSKSFLAASGNVTDSAPTAPPDCDWNSGALSEVVTFGLYAPGVPVDSDWTEYFPLLLLDKQQNYRCMQLVFERGPKVIPGLEAEYAQGVADLAARHAWAAPSLPKTGVDIAPALVFLEPVDGREYLIGQIADARWSFTDVAKMAESIWPRRSDVVRRVLMSRLAHLPQAREPVHLAVSALVRFSKQEDFEFVRSRVDWTDPNTARRLRLSLLSKNREIAPVVRALGSKVGAEYVAAADALLQWGHADVVCKHLKAESNAKRADGIAGRYTSFRRGDCFSWLPDDVIASIQKAPQAWECLPTAIKPSPYNAPRDTTKDLAARWYRPPLGEDAPPCRSSELADRFLEFASDSFDYGATGVHDAFQPYMPGLETCLKRWVEDGGEKDGLPLLGRGVTRMTYRGDALAILGELSPGNDRVAAWVRSSMHTWPETLQNQAVNTLGEIGGSESFAFLKAEARRSDGAKRETIWWALLLIDPEQFAAELDSIAPAHDQQVMLGAMLVSVNHRRAVPALRRLKSLVPEKANVYEEYIRYFQSGGGEAQDHAN